MPMLLQIMSHHQSHFQPHFNYLDQRNVMALLMSHGITWCWHQCQWHHTKVNCYHVMLMWMASHDQKKWCSPSFQLSYLGNAVVLLMIPLTSHDAMLAAVVFCEYTNIIKHIYNYHTQYHIIIITNKHSVYSLLEGTSNMYISMHTCKY